MDSGDLLAGRYLLEGHLGGGGMGQVWRARDQTLDRAVAVKVMARQVSGNAELDRELLNRFEREAKAVAALQHPGIAVVHDFGTHEGTPFIVMELLDGPNFTGVLAAYPGGLPGEMAASLMAQVAAALAYAHDRGIVHRDVKPANLMRTADGGAKVCDFGIARLTVREDGAGGAIPVTQLTQIGTVLGTPAYMAPEQWRGEAADARTDLYAFGCTLHELLTGTPPFPGATSEALRYQHLNAPPPRLDALRAGMPAGLSDLLQGLLAKDAADRPADAARVSAALAALRTARSAQETQTVPPRAQSPRATPGESRPGDSATVAATSQEIARRAAEEGFKVSFWIFGPIFAFVLSIIYNSKGGWPFLHEDLVFDLVAGFFVGGSAGGGLGAAIGFQSARRSRPDIFALDAEKLSITRRWSEDPEPHRRPNLATMRTLSVRWEALQRVVIESKATYRYQVITWFLPDRRPSPEWMRKHGVAQRVDGGYIVLSSPPEGIYDFRRGKYRVWRAIWLRVLRKYFGDRRAVVVSRPAPVDRLRDAFPKYAGALYQDPDHVPDP